MTVGHEEDAVVHFSIQFSLKRRTFSMPYGSFTVSQSTSSSSSVDAQQLPACQLHFSQLLWVDSPSPALLLVYERTDLLHSIVDVSFYPGELRSILYWAELRLVCACIFREPHTLIHAMASAAPFPD
jgi:hypothetical protein